MRDSGLEGRFGGEMLRKMDRIAVAGDLGEADDVRRRNCLLQDLAHPDRQVFEVKRLQTKHFRFPEPAMAGVKTNGSGREMPKA